MKKTIENEMTTDTHNTQQDQPTRTWRSSRWLWLGVSLLILGGSFWLNPRPRMSMPVFLEIGSEAPEFTLYTVDDERVQLSSLRGKPVVLNFWASWCTPCVEEMPELEAIWQEYNQGDVIVLAVNQGQRKSVVQDFMESHPDLSFPMLLDENKRVNRAYQVRALPTTYSIDADGRIQDVILGWAPGALKKHLNEVMPVVVIADCQLLLGGAGSKHDGILFGDIERLNLELDVTNP